MDFMKYHYCKLDKDHFSGVVGVKAHFESTDKRMGDGKKKERMSKTTLLFLGGEQTKGATAIGKHKVIIRFFKMGNI